MLQWLKYSAVPHGLTFYTEKSQTIKMVKTDFYCLYSIVIGPKIIADSQSKVYTYLYSRCQCFTDNLLSYWNGYDISAHFGDEIVAL